MLDQNQAQNKRDQRNTKFLDLKNYGFRAAGKSSGNIISFEKELALIYTGALIDKSTTTPLTPEEEAELNRKQDIAENKIKESQIDVDRIETKLGEIEDEIDEKQKLLRDFKLGSLSKDHLLGQVKPPNKEAFIITSFFGIMLSIFIFFFYVAVVYKALFMSQEELLEGMRSGEFGINLLPNWSEIVSAMSTNTMIVFAPFVFFAFGYAIHLLISASKNKLKWLGVAAVVIITFLLDYLLALRIHDRMNESQAIMGLEENSQFEDVLIVLIFGFVVYIIWSVIFHSWMNELSKRNIPQSLAKHIQELKDEKASLREEKAGLKNTVAKLENEIVQINRNRGKGVSASMINKSLSIFTTGWFNFLSGLGDEGKELIEKSQEVFQKFVDDKNINLSPLKDGMI